MSTFVEHVRNQVARNGTEKYFTFLHGKPGDPSGEHRLSHWDLDRRARSLALWLQECGAPSTPVLLAYPPGLAFIEAFLACLYAGAIAVPVPMPTTPGSIERTKRIVQNAGIRLALSATSEQTHGLAQYLKGSDDVRCIATDTVIDADPDGWRMPDITPATTAFLQYTSGSTGEPKGVIVSHSNLMHNETQIQRAIDTTVDDVFVGWLPHFHDMGLIGQLLQPLYAGCDCVQMAPSTFLRRPARWLEAATHYAGTIIIAPDFAYDLCARTLSDEQLEKLDLSKLRGALNGAEPIRARTIESFSARFASVGLSPTALSPCYGMAEITLFATNNATGAMPVLLDVDAKSIEQGHVRLAKPGDTVQRVVGSGNVGDIDLRIVDPQTRDVLPDGGIGEIWLRSDSVAQGYWENPQAGELVFHARTAKGDGPYLRTGDLGFVMEGELFVAGRLKDVLIINGRNLYPQDIEHFVQELHPRLGVGIGATFSVEADKEHIVIVHEIKETPATIGASKADMTALIKAAVSHEFEVAAPSVVLVQRGDVRRTTSGKVQRKIMRDLFMAKQLDALHEDIQAPLRKLLSAVPDDASYAPLQKIARA